MADGGRQIAEVLERRLGQTRRRRGRNWLVSLLPAMSAQADGNRPRALDRLIRGSGIDPEAPGRLADEEAAELVRRLEGLEVSAAPLPELLQAYARATGRIVAAEAALTRQELAAAPAAKRAAVLDGLLDTLLPVTSAGFDLLHETLLHEALRETLVDIDAPLSDRAVALVDVVGSTRYLAEHGDAQLQALVDALFDAGQGATAGRPVHVVKYVGDGVFLDGEDVEAVAAAALDAIAVIENDLPLRVRGGLAYGPTLSRAGDIFGIPVNAAQLLCKQARPGSLLAERAALDRMPAQAYREVRALPSDGKLGAREVASVRRRS